jgi:hypothetical protein
MKILRGIGLLFRVPIPRYDRSAWSRFAAGPLVWTALMIFAGTFCLASHSVGASSLFVKNPDVTAPTIDDLFKKWGAVYGVEWRLLKAIAITESRLNPDAVNSRDKESIGLMQVLCHPDGEGGCSNRLNVDGWSGATRKKLFDPHFNIRIGTQILAWNIRTYGMPKAVAVYNRWAERTSPVAGPFENQSYVDAVLDNNVRKAGIDIHGGTREQSRRLNRQLADAIDPFGQLKQAPWSAAGLGSAHRIFPSANSPFRLVVSPDSTRRVIDETRKVD